MLSMDLPPATLANIALAGDALTLVLFLIPAFTTAPAIYLAGTIGGRSPLPSIATLLTCCVGILYGVARRDSLLLVLNIIRAILQTIYVLFFITYSASRRLILLQCLVPALGYAVILVLYLFEVMGADALAIAVGICVLLVHLATLFNLLYVRRTWTMESMPHPAIPAFSLISTPTWILYALARKDPKYYIAIPNCLGLASALLQLGLHSYFRFLGQQPADVDALSAPLLAQQTADVDDPALSAPLLAQQTTDADDLSLSA